MKSIFEEMGGTYRQVGDYFIPILVLTDDGDYQIGKYGRMRRSYLKEHRKILYTNYVVEGTLFKHRKSLLAEKKETPFYQIPKLHDLTRRITELTEEIEELKTEKEMLLCSLECTDDAGISDVKKEIATLESALQKLSEQEAKYSAELDQALKQYAELKEKAAGMDAAELMDARFAVREEKERSAIDKVRVAYDEKYDPMMMHDSKRDVANLLHEEAEARSIRERLHQKQQQQARQRQNKTKHHEQER